MKVSQLAKVIGIDYKDVISAVNDEFNVDIKHYSNNLTEDQIGFIRSIYNHDDEALATKTPVEKAVLSRKPAKLEEEMSWKDMPWDKVLRTRTAGHKEWVAENPKAWESYLEFQRLIIKQERARYISKLRELA